MWLSFHRFSTGGTHQICNEFLLSEIIRIIIAPYIYDDNCVFKLFYYAYYRFFFFICVWYDDWRCVFVDCFWWSNKWIKLSTLTLIYIVFFLLLFLRLQIFIRSIMKLTFIFLMHKFLFEINAKKKKKRRKKQYPYQRIKYWWANERQSEVGMRWRNEKKEYKRPSSVSFILIPMIWTRRRWRKMLIRTN